LVVVTNQSGIGRGYYDLDALAAVHRRFEQLLQDAGVSLSGIYFCPHAPDHGCACRKPKTGLAEQAAADLGLKLGDSVVVGDKASDIHLGRAVGASYVAQITAKAGARVPEADGHFESILELAGELL
jgi:histidinol-phosphate phosphatase family protein